MTKRRDFIVHISESIDLKQRILGDSDFLSKIDSFIDLAVEAYRSGNKLLFCGNGGSAADAQHLAAELSGRYMYDRPPLFAEALHVNSSYMTAVANDYSFEMVYSRMVEAAGKEGDVLVAFSTSGNSPNIIHAIQKAKSIGMKTVVFTGESGGKAKEIADVLINVPSKKTPVIQESHIMIGHIACEWIEKEIFPR